MSPSFGHRGLVNATTKTDGVGRTSLLRLWWFSNRSLSWTHECLGSRFSSTPNLSTEGLIFTPVPVCWKSCTPCQAALWATQALVPCSLPRYRTAGSCWTSLLRLLSSNESRSSSQDSFGPRVSSMPQLRTDGFAWTSLVRLVLSSRSLSWSHKSLNSGLSATLIYQATWQINSPHITLKHNVR
jgi:hypothetical protein